MSTKPRAILALENGLIFEGYSFGAEGETQGETVFHTGMSGYQEIITDPSYKGQMVVMTYPHIGNTGINPFDNESDQIHCEALIVKEYCESPSNWRSTQSLGSFLQESKIPAIGGIDTRQLTRVLRGKGSLRAIVSTQDFNRNRLIEKARQVPSLEGQNLASLVSTLQPYEVSTASDPTYHVVAFDLGIKKSIIQRLLTYPCRMTVVPLTTRANEILELKPDGIFLSNGPGDPSAVKEVIETIKKLIGKKPIFGICLGHQILALALGGKTSKLKFGHHGANHPVRHEKTKVVEITSQNHSFVVNVASLPKSIELTHMNLNDQTIEGFRDSTQHILSIQYHPEASPGPHDSYYLFKEFINMMERQR